MKKTEANGYRAGRQGSLVFLAVLLLFVTTISPLIYVQTPGSFSGTITDSSGASIVGGCGHHY